MTEIQKVAIVGSGTMGSRIAFRCIVSGKRVFLFDVSSSALTQAKERNDLWLDKRIRDGQLTIEKANSISERLHLCTSLSESVKDAELVIETVPEKLELKRQVFEQVEKLATKYSIIATNSSSIPCSRLAEAIHCADRILNINFSDPSNDQDKLVELMGSKYTSSETLSIAEGFVRSLGMVPIVTKREIIGFSFNRIWRAIKKESLYLVGEGFADCESIDRAWMLEFHTPYGPFGLMDKVGLDVIRDIEMRYYLESGDESDKPPKFLEEMIKKGFLGEKSGKGFYKYPNPSYEKQEWLYLS